MGFDFDPLLLDGAAGFCSWATLQNIADGRSNAHRVPHLCFPPTESLGLSRIQTHAVWARRHVHIVQECHEVLPVHAPVCHLEGLMFTNGEQEWHQGVTYWAKSQLGRSLVLLRPVLVTPVPLRPSPRQARPIHNIVRVCVKASPAEGWRRLHTNMAVARLLIFNRPSCRRPAMLT